MLCTFAVVPREAYSLSTRVMENCRQTIRRWTHNVVHPHQPITIPQTLTSSNRWIYDLPKTDINGRIQLSIARCVLSLISITLLVTDVPRTGLGIQSIAEFFPETVAPDTAIRFGPYAYSVVHIVCDQDKPLHPGLCQGSSGLANISSVPVWPYAFDTTSIGLRSVAELLKLTPAFPEYLLNRGNDSRRGNPNAQINLDEAFNMLESIAENSHRYLHYQSKSRSIPSISLSTQYKYLDRLSDYLLQWIRPRERFRDFLVQSYTKHSKSLSEMLWICRQHQDSHKRKSNRPALCDHHVRWMSPHPTEPLQPPVAIWDHISLRLQALQERYQELWLDVTLLSMQELVSTSSLTRAAIFDLEASDIIVLTRGKSCRMDHPDTNCTTVFVDDYRYERYLLTTNVADLYRITSLLRGTAQVYVWTRLLLLLYTSYAAQAECQDRKTKLRNTFVTILKIPFQVVVYGSWIPVTLYVLAHLFDGNFVDAYLEVYWASIGGSVGSFDLVGFVRVASVQMRNVWLLALFAKFYVLMQTRGSRWRANLGVYGVRGLAISYASFLSIFGPYRSLTFRNCDVVKTQFIGDITCSRADQVRLLSSAIQNVMVVGDSMVTTFAVVAAMLAASALICIVGRKGLRDGVLFVPSIVVPYAAGTLWPLSALGIRFYASVKDKVGKERSQSPVGPLAPIAIFTIPTQALIAVSSRQSWRRSIPHCISSRTTPSTIPQHVWHSIASRSLVKLMNITMMSDPWTFCKLFVFGRNLYIYQTRSNDSNPRHATSPSVNIFAYSPAELLRQVGFGEDEYYLIAEVKSIELTVAVMLCCA